MTESLARPADKLPIVSMIQGACGLGVGWAQTAEEVQPPRTPGSSQNPSEPVLHQHHPLNGTVSHSRVNFVKMRKYTDVDDGRALTSLSICTPLTYLMCLAVK